MLQRIQSIYLLLASLCLLGLFAFPLVHNVYVGGKPTTIMITGLYQDVSGQQAHTEFFVALSAATAIAALLPLIIIFLYKNRKLQMNLCYAAMVVLIGFSYWSSQTVKNTIDAGTVAFSNYGIGIILMSASILLLVLAQKAIQRDDKLVKSADRLR